MLSRKQTDFAPHFCPLCRQGEGRQFIFRPVGFYSTQTNVYCKSGTIVFVFVQTGEAASGAAGPDGGQEADSMDFIDSVGLPCKV